MRGKILSYDDYTGSGLISGDDGARYSFTRSGLMGVREVNAGAEVDFEVNDSVATNIYVTGGARSSSDKNKIAAALLAFFLGWLAKWFTLRFGGMSAYRRALPFFLGLILGDYVIASLWTLFGIALGIDMYRCFPN